MRPIRSIILAFALALITPILAFAQTPTPQKGTLEVSLKPCEGREVPSFHLLIQPATRDPNGKWFSNESSVGMLDFTKGSTATLTLPPGTYIANSAGTIYSKESVAWTLVKHLGAIEIKPTEKKSFSVTLSCIDVTARQPSGALSSYATQVYEPFYNANHELDFPGDYIDTRRSNNLLTTFYLVPGTYAFFLSWPDTPLWQNRVEEIKVEPGIRYLKTNLVDWQVPNGWYYTQSGNNQGGYNVTNEGGIGLWNEFQRLGGVDLAGYPVSRRFTYNGLVAQAFQKGVLVWNPTTGSASFADTLHDLVKLKGEAWLNAQGVPIPTGFSSEEDAWAVLDLAPDIKSVYFANPNYLEAYGLPEGLSDDIQVVRIRTAKAVFECWKVRVPGVAEAGQVTLMNIGDVVKKAGLVSPEAMVPSTALS